MAKPPSRTYDTGIRWPDDIGMVRYRLLAGRWLDANQGAATQVRQAALRETARECGVLAQVVVEIHSPLQEH